MYIANVTVILPAEAEGAIGTPQSQHEPGL
jgi:hypothetical protein